MNVVSVPLDAVVIGAGLSGLVCARRLVGAGLSVRVLEARDRVGGRLLTANVGGAQVDLGGAWLTAGQTRLVALCSELDVGHREHVRAGTALVDEAGGFVTKVAAAFAQRRAIRTIESLMGSIPEGAPAQAPQAALLDRMTLAGWLDETVHNRTARERIRMHADLVLAQDPADVSLLSYLTIMGATGGFRPDGPELPGGGREHGIDGGAQELALRLAEALPERVLVLGERVRAIEEAGDSVAIRTERGEHRAARAILAVPPVLVRDISVELPAEQRSYVAGVRVGAVVKCVAVYARPFWRDRGLSGEAYMPRGTVRATVELAGPPPALVAFVVGPPAARWAAREPADRRAEVLAILAAQFGDEAERPVAYAEQDWAAERLSGGCVAATPPDVLAHGARWREPAGRLHVAGTESAIRWPGYMDGAIEAGERAAAEVIEALR